MEQAEWQQPTQPQEFWRERTLAEVFRGSAPFEPETAPAIEDITDDEWDAFLAALAE